MKLLLLLLLVGKKPFQTGSLRGKSTPTTALSLARHSGERVAMHQGDFSVMGLSARAFSEAASAFMVDSE